MSRRAIWLGFLVLWLGYGPALAGDAEHVAFIGLDGQVRKAPTMLNGLLFEPDGVDARSAGSLPAVIMLHGCKGMMLGDQLRALDAAWAEHWRDQGYAVLLIDSYTPRGIASLCRTEEKDRPISSARERARDAYAGLRWLVARREIDGSRVALIGWASGGGAVLNAIRPAMRDAFSPVGHGFRAAIAFYPSNCRVLHQLGGWAPYPPTLILMGEADDWTPPGPCAALVGDAVAHRADAAIGLFPGAYHDFDAPATDLRERPTGTAGRSAHSGTDEAARDAAIAAATEFLRGHLTQ
jgi:dienelactone hydrolase